MLAQFAGQLRRAHLERAALAIERRTIRHGAPFPRARLLTIGAARPLVATAVKPIRLDLLPIRQSEDEMQFDIQKRIAAWSFQRQFNLPNAAMGSDGSGGNEVRGGRACFEEADEDRRHAKAENSGRGSHDSGAGLFDDSQSVAH